MAAPDLSTRIALAADSLAGLDQPWPREIYEVFDALSNAEECARLGHVRDLQTHLWDAVQVAKGFLWRDDESLVELRALSDEAFAIGCDDAAGVAA
jgi:hypothetical protein